MPRSAVLLLALVAAALLLAAAAAAQDPGAPSGPPSGTLSGTVTDTRGAPLRGANVAVVGTGLGTSAGPDGTYRIGGLRPGTYTVAASLVGYAPLRRAVTVAAGEGAVADFRMAEAPLHLGEVLALADRPFSAASSRALRAFDVETRPVNSTQDLLRLAPGLVVAQHAGGGKAEQIFLRGFDADHGTDVAVSVDGVPVNMVSHGHGQGYADLHFVIPETVEAVDVYKGPYFAPFGNLATAGAVALRTRDHLDGNLVRAEAGRFNTAAVTALLQVPTPGPHQGAYFAGSFHASDGPFERGQGLRRFNVFGKAHTHLSEATSLALDVGGYGAAWDASGQVPARAVARGLITRFGAIDDLEGGTTGRHHVNARYTVRGPDGGRLDLQAYAVRYDFKLFSNFTFFLEDEDLGDMIEQTDGRTVSGLAGTYRFGHPAPAPVRLATATLGGGLRADDADVALWRSPGRLRTTRLAGAHLVERNFYLWAQEELAFGEGLRLLLGLRGDYFTFDVEDHLDAVADPPGGLPHASGYAQELVLSPKASLVVSPSRALDLFANVGVGFHSNDARDVVIGRRVDQLARALRGRGLSEAEVEAELSARNFDPAQNGAETLPRAVGGEVGGRVRFGARAVLGAAAWVLDLEREFVFVGDAGTTELSGRTRRVGVDLEARLQLLPWLTADGDLNLSRGRFVDAPAGEDRVPLAPTLTSTGGLTARHPAGVRGSLRYRAVADRPANEAGTVTAAGHTLVDALVAYRLGPTELALVLENALDAAWNEAQFDTESRLRGEAAPVSELHFTPGTPRSVRVGVSYRF